MMIDIKIQHVLNSIPSIKNRVIIRYSKNLDIYGKQEATLGFSIELFRYCLSLPGLGDTLKLELYKRFNVMLRETNLINFIPPMEPVQGVISAPFYYGSTLPNSTPEELQAILTIDVSPLASSKFYNFTAVEQVFVFAYPVSYGILFKVLDQNLFLTTLAWKRRTEIFIINEQEIPYYVYETKYITTLLNYTNSFYF